MAEHLVSIIIPVFNRASFLETTLNSIRGQSYLNWECILIDDHSTDDSWEILKEFEDLDSRFKVFKRPDNKPKGANACRNFGFENAEGKYINFFDSDDLMEHNFLENKIISFQEYTDLVLSKTKIHYPEEQKDYFESRTQLTSNVLEDFITRKISWYLPDPMYLKSFLDEHQIKFDEQLLGGQDRDFFQRILLVEPLIIIVNEYLTTYIKHGSSISEKIYKQGDFKVSVSRVSALLGFINLLESKNRLSGNLKFFYIKELRKMIPLVYIDSRSRNALLKTLLKLSDLNLNTFKSWIKIGVGLISLKITGKGQKLFK